MPNLANGTTDYQAEWKTILSLEDFNLVNLAKFISHITSHLEFDKTDIIDFDDDWHKVKQAKVSRAGRILKPNSRYPIK